MALVYKRVKSGAGKGKTIEKAVALTYDVQIELMTQVDEAAGRARAALAGHKYEGHAEIETNNGRVDHYLILSDERGMSAAMSIELGRSPGINPNGTRDSGMEGLHIITGAFGIEPLRKEGPRRQRRSRPKAKKKRRRKT